MSNSRLRDWELVPYDYSQSAEWNRKNREKQAMLKKTVNKAKSQVKKLKKELHAAEKRAHHISKKYHAEKRK